jgi:hypothetical protein
MRMTYKGGKKWYSVGYKFQKLFPEEAKKTLYDPQAQEVTCPECISELDTGKPARTRHTCDKK